MEYIRTETKGVHFIISSKQRGTQRKLLPCNSGLLLQF